ncbi:hypothetical protein QR680_001717 [Steinernema hermaphroditum]|uniref:G-protein coupled receptors family 1 profile domain-containing protein n=1 Tax=Steinernema hermaphroditum TaxID=289476 RepID=A0AA39GZJ3_9BILA|nr:hypothetical protein QR680_001717 [Steinernema hermaphroditum]
MVDLLITPDFFPTECTTFNETYSKTQLLYMTSILERWPNFTNCRPHCGMCQLSQRDHSYTVFNLVLIGFVLPFIGMCGLLGNGLSAFVYSRPAMRSSTNSYLCALGCSDSAVICTAIFLFCVDSVRRYSLTLSVIYGALSSFIYPLGMAAQTCSVYFTLAAGIDCFVQVCLTEKLKSLISHPSFVRKSVIGVVLFSIFYNIPHCFEAVVLECWHPQFQNPSLEMCPAPFRFLPSYMLIYYKYMYSLFLAIGPLVVLVILNSCIIFATMFVKKGSDNANTGDTISLVLVVLLFLTCNAAALLLNVLEARLAELLGPRLDYVVDASNLLVVLNSSFNFCIYVTFSSQFRRTLRQCFSTTKTRPAPRRVLLLRRQPELLI